MDEPVTFDDVELSVGCHHIQLKAFASPGGRRRCKFCGRPARVNVTCHGPLANFKLRTCGLCYIMLSAIYCGQVYEHPPLATCGTHCTACPKLQPCAKPAQPNPVKTNASLAVFHSLRKTAAQARQNGAKAGGGCGKRRACAPDPAPDPQPAGEMHNDFHRKTPAPVDCQVAAGKDV